MRALKSPDKRFAEALRRIGYKSTGRRPVEPVIASVETSETEQEQPRRRRGRPRKDDPRYQRRDMRAED